jgi:hypothetical protein
MGGGVKIEWFPELPRKDLAMTKDAETTPEPGSASPNSEHGPPRKGYQSPSLVEWGSLVELTRGPLADIQDDDFSGSGGV